jgi:isopenicillin N synthase-like dioxygenase
VVPGPLPIHPLDLEPFRLGDAADRRLVAARLDAACRDSGFLLVNGHGIAPQLCDAVLDAFGGFFDLPIEEKRRFIVADEAADRGYSELGKEALAYSRGEATPPDLFEAFNVGREDAVGPYFDRHRAFFAPNVWPNRPAGLRDVWLDYDRHVSEVSDALLRAMAIALALPEMWFVERSRQAIVTYRAIHYEHAPAMAAPEPGQMRMGAHTDYGILTLLLADDVPGLQIFRDGVWHDIDAPRGSFVCNIGDMIERWTNERWTSTLHRVTPPSHDGDGVMTRRSIARFLDCEPDRVVQCIPSCTGADRPARYGPVLAGDWLQAKVLGGRSRALAELPGVST